VSQAGSRLERARERLKEAREDITEAEAEFAGAAVESVTARLENAATDLGTCMATVQQIPEVGDLDYNSIRREAVKELQQLAQRCLDVRTRLARLRRGR